MVPDTFDVAVIGGGIVGVSAAAFLAERGLSVALFERDHIAAAASGRNSGAIQHPFDAHLAALHHETIAIYRELAQDGEFQLQAEPRGLLLLSSDTDAVADAAVLIAAHSPELRPEVLDREQLHHLEPALAPDLVACRLETGYPVAPAAATEAFAQRARRAGVAVHIGEDLRLELGADKVIGVRLASGRPIAANRVLVAAGPWTAQLIPGWSEAPPITPLWGVVVTAALEQSPRAVLEELGIDRPGPRADELFSLVTVGADTSVGSTFLAEHPDPNTTAAGILARGARYVPALAGAPQTGLRACARPASFDGLPIIGAVEEIAGLYVCSGHGPWGISTGPASSRLVVDEMLGRGSAPAELSASRVSRSRRAA